jgi:hypothetical protein
MNARGRYKWSREPEGIGLRSLNSLIVRLFVTLALVGVATMAALRTNRDLADGFSEVHAVLFFGVLIFAVFAFRGRTHSISYPMALLPSRLGAPLGAFAVAATLPLKLWYKRAYRGFALIMRASAARQHFSAGYGEIWTEFVRRTQLNPVLVVFGSYDDSVGETLAVLVRELGLRAETRDFDRFIEPGPEEAVLVVCIDGVQADLLRNFASQHGRRGFFTSLEDVVDDPASFSAALEGLLMGSPPGFSAHFSEYFREWLALFAIKSARERLRFTAEDRDRFERRRAAS